MRVGVVVGVGVGVRVWVGVRVRVDLDKGEALHAPRVRRLGELAPGSKPR